MNAKKVIIDCDPGIDDALALMLALRSPELDILGSQLSLEMYRQKKARQMRKKFCTG